MLPEFDLTGRVAVVTGGSRGIGRGIAELLAQRGADVAVTYRTREAEAADVGCAVQRAGHRSFVGRCDVADRQQVEQFFADVARDLGTVDVLVNNAGVTATRTSIMMDAGRWDQVLAHEPGWRLPLHPCGGARHAAGPAGPHHQHHVAECDDAAAGAGELRGVEGGTRRAHPRARAGPGAPRCPRQRRVTRDVDTDMLASMPRAPPGRRH